MALSAVVDGEEPIVSRIDRLDHMLMHLEEIKGCNNRRSSLSPSRSSCASTQSTGSGTITTPRSDGPNSSSLDCSPKSLEKYCRPIDTVVMEIESKGSLIDRLNQVENRVLKLCEQQMEEEKKIHSKEEEQEDEEMKVKKKKEHKKSLKQLVKSIVHPRGGGKSKTNKNEH